MPTDDDNAEERLVRLEALIDEFKQAQHRRLMKQGLAFLDRTMSAPVTGVADPAFDKMN
jgi:hypothetical protein